MSYLKRYLLFFALVLVFLVTNQAYAGILVKESYVIRKDQIPSSVKNDPDYVYLIYHGNYIADTTFKKACLSGDTIINLNVFLEKAGAGAVGFRLIFANNTGRIDSLLEFNMDYTLKKKLTVDLTEGYAEYKLFITVNDKLKLKEQFIVRYNNNHPEKVLTDPQSYSPPDYYKVLRELKENVAINSAWVLSIGNDDYGAVKFAAGEKDAIAYDSFFRKQFNAYGIESNFHSYVLNGKDAKKDSIINALKDIASKAAPGDYFIFNFSGMSHRVFKKGKDTATYFIMHDVISTKLTFINRDSTDKRPVLDNMLSLKELQEYIQQIPADNQLFISEAGYYEKFRIEFVRSLMQNSAAVASILNKNRVIITPNGFGMERNDIDETGPTGTLRYLITHLDPAYNIFNIFGSERSSSAIVNDLKKRDDRLVDENYFDVFFEQKFLQDYNAIFGDGQGLKRGITIETGELKKAGGLTGKRYALVLGTDNYQGKGWVKLANPVYDATEVAEQLEKNYGFEVTMLTDAPMDSIYAKLGEFYRVLQPNDQFIFFVAGHGDFEQGLLDDGFIVCADSRSTAEDPMRNTYIQHSKLKKMINKMPARQVLVMLDICFGGTFDEQILGKTRDNTNSGLGNANVIQYLTEKSAYQTRKVLSSAGKEPAFDGRTGKHSPFTNLLLQVLRAKGGGTNGLVTLSNIFDVLQTASLNETETLRITPHKASFGDDEALGEFILIPVHGLN